MKKEQGDIKGTHMNVERKHFDSAESLWLHFMTLHKSISGFDVHSGKAGRINGDDMRSAPNPVADDLKARSESIHIEILSSLNAAYKGRRLLMDHLRVLNFYGQKGVVPRSWINREALAATLWKEAMAILTPIWQDAGYLRSDMARLWEAAEAYVDEMPMQAYQIDVAHFSAGREGGGSWR